MSIDPVFQIFDKIKAEEGPDLLQAMIAIFQRRIPVDIIAIEAAIKAKNLIELKQKAHLIAGSMSSLYFEKGYLLAKTAEQAAEQGPTTFAIKEATHLIDYLNTSLLVINNYKL